MSVRGRDEVPTAKGRRGAEGGGLRVSPPLTHTGACRGVLLERRSRSNTRRRRSISRGGVCGLWPTHAAHAASRLPWHGTRSTVSHQHAHALWVVYRGTLFATSCDPPGHQHHGLSPSRPRGRARLTRVAYVWRWGSGGWPGRGAPLVLVLAPPLELLPSLLDEAKLP